MNAPDFALRYKSDLTVLMELIPNSGRLADPPCYRDVATFEDIKTARDICNMLLKAKDRRFHEALSASQSWDAGEVDQ